LKFQLEFLHQAKVFQVRYSTVQRNHQEFSTTGELGSSKDCEFYISFWGTQDLKKKIRKIDLNFT